MAALTTGRQTPASLRILADQLAANADALRATADAMLSLEIAEMPVDHDNSRKIGWKGVDAFVAAVKDAIRNGGKSDKTPKKSVSSKGTHQPPDKDLGSKKGR